MMSDTPSSQLATPPLTAEEVEKLTLEERRFLDGNNLAFAHLSDAEMAGKVRMLMRGDLDHEAVCTGARDRIMHLSLTLASRDRDLAEMRRERDEAREEIQSLLDALQRSDEASGTHFYASQAATARADAAERESERLKEAVQAHIDRWAHTGKVDDLRAALSASAPAPDGGEAGKQLTAVPEPDGKTWGWCFHNPDTGMEWNENHPIQSGEVDDATDITRMTYAGFRRRYPVDPSTPPSPAAGTAEDQDKAHG